MEKSGKLAVIGDPAGLADVPGEHNPAPLLAALDETRVRKTPYEIACLARANEIAVRGHRAARDAFLAGGSEFEINLAYQQATGQREAEAPYHSIIGVNEHAGTLHYQYYDTQAPERPRSLLIDAGVRFRGYCSDITRTTPASGEADSRPWCRGWTSCRIACAKWLRPVWSTPPSTARPIKASPRC
ncbi:hypothetical protein AU14_11285 [Marinobacter similis]|uniref:Peptidase M24 domain-containing protein n=1 Tax=Marinobacter similis TaxID=1420916 RepID=W5YLY0_9GAMM|nr:hypothetical protein AU14_11285 [Marinobacter similis]